jgi:hypothetical protein
MTFQILAILAERSRRELQDRAISEAILDAVPGRRFDMVCFVNEEVRARVGEPTQRRLGESLQDGGCGDDYIGPLGELGYFGWVLDAVPKERDYWTRRTLGDGVHVRETAKSRELAEKLFP